jgi:2-polyprenyl-6-methoxyphenol hydroxylase-like FAD-dependent oxidoreductase
VLEKCQHPRFHIGESLLPANMPLLERLGVADQVKAVGMQKWGAEFVSPWHDHTQEFKFADAWDKSMPYAYQVRRSEFDEILIRNAAKCGAEVYENCKVTGVEFLADDAGAVVNAASVAGAFCDRCVRPRYRAGESAPDQAAQQAAQQRGGVCPFPWRQAP